MKNKGKQIKNQFIDSLMKDLKADSISGGSAKNTSSPHAQSEKPSSSPISDLNKKELNPDIEMELLQGTNSQYSSEDEHSEYGGSLSSIDESVNTASQSILNLEPEVQARRPEVLTSNSTLNADESDKTTLLPEYDSSSREANFAPNKDETLNQAKSRSLSESLVPSPEKSRISTQSQNRNLGDNKEHSIDQKLNEKEIHSSTRESTASGPISLEKAVASIKSLSGGRASNVSGSRDIPNAPKPLQWPPAKAPIANRQSEGETQFGIRNVLAENPFLKIETAQIAQAKIFQLENELEKYRQENELLATAHELAKSQVDDLLRKNMQLEKQRNDYRESSESELKIFRDGLAKKDQEIIQLKTKVEELSFRLSGDLRKVRSRERELENRLELAKVEKTALMKAKDETILELKRKQETMVNEIESYQRRVNDLTEKIDMNQDQFARTVRALRLALTNLEVSEENTSVAPISKIKKAE